VSVLEPGGGVISLGVCAQTTRAPTASRTISASELRKSVFHCSAVGVGVELGWGSVP
jgi:hypothetical protein